MDAIMKTGLKSVILQPGRERSLRRFHPWVYSGGIQSIEAGIEEGEAVEVQDSSGGFLACAFYSQSSIALKAFSFRKINPDANYWHERIKNAVALRAEFGLDPQNSQTNCFRLINAEGDGIPGLIIDIYGELAVIQCHSQATFKLLNLWSNALIEAYKGVIKSVFSKSAATLSDSGDEVQETKNIFVHGSVGQVVVSENSRKFFVDALSGQKTGFFVDQRDSRQLVYQIAKAKRVLNLFSYTGGFSIAAEMGGAAQVTSVDVSAPALEIVKRNYHENNLNTDNAKIIHSDCFTYLEQAQDKFDVIIVDPPPFAKSRASVDKALHGYKAINNLALKRLEAGGMLLSFSCSQVVARGDFERTIAEAGFETGKQLRIVKRLGSPLCHPVSLYHPEGDYLKGVFLSASN
jgi:23S rRNA (cytosine1962-C5)-methyltransferase